MTTYRYWHHQQWLVCTMRTAPINHHCLAVVSVSSHSRRLYRIAVWITVNKNKINIAHKLRSTLTYLSSLDKLIHSIIRRRKKTTWICSLLAETWWICLSRATNAVILIPLCCCPIDFQASTENICYDWIHFDWLSGQHSRSATIIGQLFLFGYSFARESYFWFIFNRVNWGYTCLRTRRRDSSVLLLLSHRSVRMILHRLMSVGEADSAQASTFKPLKSVRFFFLIQFSREHIFPIFLR